MNSTEYRAGLAAGKAEARTMSARAVQAYLELTTPREGDAYDAGHRAAFLEKASRNG